MRELRERGYIGGYTILKDYLRPMREASRTVAVRRFETPPGKQAQVDWGHLGTLEVDGQEHKVWGFTFTLGYSRTMMTKASLDQKLGTLLKMHEEAFEQLGGVPEEILYDFVPGYKIVILLPAVLCGLGRPRAVECGAQA
jgi:transposase